MRIRLFTCFLAGFLPLTAIADSSTSLPIREVTAFKDGHALLLRSGEATTDENGDISLGDLPRAVLGTFWADATDPNADLASVTVEQVKVDEVRPTATTESLLRANIGREIMYRTPWDEVRKGTILDVITQMPEEAAPQNQGNRGGGSIFPDQAIMRVVLIEADDSVAALPINEIRDLRFVGSPPARELTEPVKRERMRLDLDWTNGPANEHADVSLMYVQRGIRWIPSYRITMLGDDRVKIELQATLINELTDLEDVTIHLAVGVPTFAFENIPDPTALREGFDALGLYFRNAPPSQTGASMTNAIMSQMAGARFASANAGSQNNAPASPELKGGERAEDLYVFTVSGVTLGEGARMVLPLVSYEAPAQSLYSLELTSTPPIPLWQSLNNQRRQQYEQLTQSPFPRHILRITNDNEEAYPITTAPAVIIKNGRVLAQGLIRYTPPGGKADLEVGSAVDIEVSADEREIERLENDLKWARYSFAKVRLGQSTEITNRKPHRVTIEVRQFAFGLPESVGQDGEKIARSVFSREFSGSMLSETRWWFNWPFYWNRLNGFSEFRWTIEIEPGEQKTLESAWYYLWKY